MALRDFTDEDMRKIQNLLDQESRRVNGSYRPEDPSYIDKSPDVYVAKTPSAGIPKRRNLRPGSALCVIYELVPVTFGSVLKDLVKITNPDGTDYTERVYNHSETKITVDFVIIQRDKFGSWVIDCPCGVDVSSSSLSSSLSSSISSSVSESSSLSSSLSISASESSSVSSSSQSSISSSISSQSSTSSSESSISDSISQSLSSSQSSVSSESSISDSVSSSLSVSSSASVSSSVSSESSISESTSVSQSDSVSSPSDQSDKSSAIVPASWAPDGYVALYVNEWPEVVFNDQFVVTLYEKETILDIDPKFLEVCEKNLRISTSVSLPVLVGSQIVEGDKMLFLMNETPVVPIICTVTLSATRKGFAGIRFGLRNREQFLANEKFIRSAYPGAGR